MKFEYEDLGQELLESKKKIAELESTIHNLKKVIKDNDLEDELDEVPLSEEEYICRKALGHLKPLFENGTFTKDDVQQLDLVIKNLRLIQGKSIEKPKGKAAKSNNVAELLSIVEGKK